MKILHSEDVICELTNAVARSLPSVIRAVVNEINESYLCDSLRNMKASEREKIVQYLEMTEQNCTRFKVFEEIRVPSNYVGNKLGIPPGKMQSVRSELLADGTIDVPEAKSGPLVIVFRRPRVDLPPPPPATEPQQTNNVPVSGVPTV